MSRQWEGEMNIPVLTPLAPLALLGGRRHGIHRENELHPPRLESSEHPRLRDALLQSC